MRRVSGLGLLLLVCGVLVAGPASAQMGFGIKAGLNLADISDLETIDTIDELEQESKSGFVGGIHLKFPMGPFKLQVEGLYSVKGAKGNTRSSLGTKPWETKLTYIEVPLLLKYEFPTPVLKPFFYGGASAAFLMTAEKRNERIDSDWVEITDDLNSIDYGWLVGGGIGVFGITLEARYTQGISELSDTKSGDITIDDAKNKTWAVMAGIDFN